MRSVAVLLLVAAGCFPDPWIVGDWEGTSTFEDETRKTAVSIWRDPDGAERFSTTYIGGGPQPHFGRAAEDPYGGIHLYIRTAVGVNVDEDEDPDCSYCREERGDPRSIVCATTSDLCSWTEASKPSTCPEKCDPTEGDAACANCGNDRTICVEVDGVGRCLTAFCGVQCEPRDTAATCIGCRL